jgi:hypothetical protein
MLIGGIMVAVVVAALTVALFTRRLAHDDAHSVEGYHRSLHTLESINAHPGGSGGHAESGSGARPAYPESAVRPAGTSTVRVTDRPSPALPPVPRPPVVDPDSPVTFDDVGQSPTVPTQPAAALRDKAMGTINHRPRRLAAPATAVGAVLVLVVVLLMTGSHSVPPTRHHHSGSTPRHSTSSPPKAHRKQTARTTPAPQAPAVSLPQSGTTHSATYDVSVSDYTLALSASSGACWVDATSASSGATLFAGTLTAGEQRSFAVRGPVTVIIGAPTVFGATVNGAAVVLPPGFQAPFTMSVVPPRAPSS